MKRKLIIAVGLMLVCTGCGNGKKDVNETTAVYEEYVSDYDAEDDYFFDATETAAASDEAAYEGAAAGNPDADVNNTNGIGISQPKNGTVGVLDKEMLVYRGELSIDTLDFNTSVNDFKTLLNEKGGFVESESYSDNYSTSGYYAVDENDKHNIYMATVRVPSTEYDAIMNSATGLGDVRNRYSNVSNVTQQYSTYTSQLEIYEAEYNRYLSLLESATEDEYALQIENQLFEIQIQIADLKSGITNIENDVAYSYIDITIKEVSEYEEKPASTDTFIERFRNTCRDSWNGFLEVLEEIVFFFVMNIYYIIIILIIVFAVRMFIRKKKRAGRALAENCPVVKAEAVHEAMPENKTTPAHEAMPENRAGTETGIKEEKGIQENNK